MYPSVRFGKAEEEEAEKGSEGSYKNDGFPPDTIRGPSPEWIRQGLRCKERGCYQAEIKGNLRFLLCNAKAFHHKVCIGRSGIEYDSTRELATA